MENVSKGFMITVGVLAALVIAAFVVPYVRKA